MNYYEVTTYGSSSEPVTISAETFSVGDKFTKFLVGDEEVAIFTNSLLVSVVKEA